MAVTKRTRFEVLRRDEHTCQYCGDRAPDVVLHVDHVIPVSLGGSDKPDNLVAACRDCNTGKSSIQPDAPLVTAVSMRAAEWALAANNRNAHIQADFRAMEQFEEEFFEDWGRWTFRKGIKDVKVPTPSDWRSTMKAWWRMRVPRALIQSAVETAMGANHVDFEDRFRYFCGVVWWALDEYDTATSASANEGRVFGPDDLEEHGMDEWRRGYGSGERAAARVIKNGDLLRHHIDGTEPLYASGLDHYGWLVA